MIHQFQPPKRLPGLCHVFHLYSVFLLLPFFSTEIQEQYFLPGKVPICSQVTLSLQSFFLRQSLNTCLSHHYKQAREVFLFCLFVFFLAEQYSSKLKDFLFLFLNTIAGLLDGNQKASFSLASCKPRYTVQTRLHLTVSANRENPSLMESAFTCYFSSFVNPDYLLQKPETAQYL